MEKKRRYIVKGNLSGIQEFIFDVKSKGAARELKKRSLYVSQLSKNLLKEDQSFFKNDDFQKIYEGGGNYFYEITTAKDAQQLGDYFKAKNAKYLTSNLYPNYAITTHYKSFQEGIKAVNKATLRKKQQRLLALHPFVETKEELNLNLNGYGINYHYPKDESDDVLDFDHLSL